jgi:glycerate kinase
MDRLDERSRGVIATSPVTEPQTPLQRFEALGARADALRAVELAAATDVDSPLLGPAGATAMFAAQKGATEQQLSELEDRLARYAATTAPALAVRPGAGAAGGLGFALFTLGGVRVSGADLVLAVVDLDGRVAGSDLVITGEGSLDAQSLRGKLPVRGQPSALPVSASTSSMVRPCSCISCRAWVMT